VRSSDPGLQIEWFKFGNAVEATQSLEITQVAELDSIREQGGELQLRADLTPVTSTSTVSWEVTDEDDSYTNLASISTNGLLTARGASGGNGIVKVTATSAGHSASKLVMVTNQLPANKVTISGSPKTIDYPILRTGAAFGANDNIQRYQGTNQQTVVSSELFSENAAGYHQSGTYLTVPTSEFNWTVEAADGGPTAIATVNASGLVTAAGTADGKIVVKATLKNNPDIVAERAITLQNQGTKNPVKQIHAENYDAGSATLITPATTWGVGGNQMGLQVPVAANGTLTFKNVDFAALNPKRAAVRVAPNTATATNGRVEIWIDSATTGTKVADIAVSTGNVVSTYATFTAAVAGNPQGVHDVIVRSTAALRLDWFTFSQFSTDNMFLLEASLDAARPLYANQALYTPASWAAFDAAFTDAESIVASGVASDLRINAAIEALTDATNGLEWGLYLAILEDAIAQADAILASPSDYVSSTLTGLAAANNAAKALVPTPPGTTQTQVNDAAMTLIAAIQRALLKGDTAALQALVDLVRGLNPATYTTGSWAPVASALTNADAVLALTEASALQVTEAFDPLRASLTGLVARPVKTGLASAISIGQVIADNIGAYAPSSVVGFVDTLNAAKAVYDDANATAAQVAAAQSNLMAGVMAAKLRPAVNTLSATVSQSQKLSLLGYSTASVNALVDALAAGRAVLGDPEATQPQVDAAVASIKAAVAGLAKAPEAGVAPAADVTGTAGATAAASTGKAKVLQSTRPAVTGKATVGRKLKAVTGSWTADTKVTYRWYRNGKAIAKATSKVYKVRAADAGKRIVVKVTGTKAGFPKVVRASAAVKIAKK
jgi:hypothetical protein